MLFLVLEPLREAPNLGNQVKMYTVCQVEGLTFHENEKEHSKNVATMTSHGTLKARKTRNILKIAASKNYKN